MWILTRSDSPQPEEFFQSHRNFTPRLLFKCIVAGWDASPEPAGAENGVPRIPGPERQDGAAQGGKSCEKRSW